MKILQVNTVCGYGSTGRITVSLAEHIRLFGAQCEIAYGRQSAEIQACPDAYYIGSYLDHNCHALLSRVTDRQGFYSKKATVSLINHIREYDPDIIHLHNIHGYYLHVPFLFEFLSSYGKPVIWTLHDCWPFTGHCTYFDLVNCEKWKAGCNHCPQKEEYPASLILDQSKKNYAEKAYWFKKVSDLHLIAPSMWLNNLIHKSFLKGIDCRVIYNGIDLSKFKRNCGTIRRKYGLDDKLVLLGVASIWGQRKGFRDFLELSKIVDKNTAIIMVGLSADQKRGLPESIIGIERTNSVEELSAFYSDADYYLNFTYQDNFPTTNIEALACGTPVVTYNVGGSVEAADKKSGLTIEKGDYQAVKNLRKKQFDPVDCIARAQRFDAKRQANEYYSAYLEVLSEKS